MKPHHAMQCNVMYMYTHTSLYVSWSSKKARDHRKSKRVPGKHLLLLYLLCQSLWLWISINCGKFLKDTGISDHLICLLRNLYAGQEATLRTGHGTTDWFHIGKGVRQGYILSPCLFSVYAEYIMRNTGLDEEQAGITIVERNINNLRYADDTTLMAEHEEELKSLLMKEKEESEIGSLKLNFQKNKIMAFSPITSWQIAGETVETVADYFGELQNHCRWWLQPWNPKMLAPWEKSYDQPRKHIKRQRQYSVKKSPSSQGYSSSSGHVWMWELDYKESWALKNGCFGTVVLEKTLESPWTKGDPTSPS